MKAVIIELKDKENVENNKVVSIEKKYQVLIPSLGGIKTADGMSSTGSAFTTCGIDKESLIKDLKNRGFEIE